MKAELWLMHRIILLFFLLLIGQMAFSQDDYVTEPNCVYLTFDQWEKDAGWALTTDDNDGKLYSVIDPDGKGHVLKSRELWGKRIDGQDYIRYSKSFSELDSIGRYRYFSYERKGGGLGVGGAQVAIRIDPGGTNVHMILDTNTGMTHTLNRKLMQQILSDNPDLLQEYNHELNKGIEEHLNYLRRLNSFLEKED